MDFFIFALGLLFLLAICDLIVGVSNDAVNFLNSAIGCRVASLKSIMCVAALGMFVGVTFSSGMMEVARKGIFHPSKFLMPEMIIIFLAVMLTDVILLDFFNTFGMPTSTTVSIVFELLGAAVCVALIKVTQAGEGMAAIADYINTARALIIIMGILLSVAVAFTAGAIVQFLSRLIFTFEFSKRLRAYGPIWGGIALATITYFILIKGAKGSVLMTDEIKIWVATNTFSILGASAILWCIVLYLLCLFTKVNIFKPIVLIGTFALALAFAANDLVNFIGVPLAGLNAYQAAQATANPLTSEMGILAKKVPSNTFILLLAGLIMVITLWRSKKARTVTQTSLDLGRQDEGMERFGSSMLARALVRGATNTVSIAQKITPVVIQKAISRRFEISQTQAETPDAPPFDLVRASVNLLVASAVISYATSYKLPLSTTYVTFMVAMGASLADRAWGRDSAVYRVTGVLLVMAGWFMTAIIAFIVSMTFAFFLYTFQLPAVIVLSCFAGFMVYRGRTTHAEMEQAKEEVEVATLKKVKDADYAISASFQGTGKFLSKVANAYAVGYEGLTQKDRHLLASGIKQAKQLQKLAGVVITNILKTLRLLESSRLGKAENYANTIMSVQSIAESVKQINGRGYQHVYNSHSGLLPVQIEELDNVQRLVVEILQHTAAALQKVDVPEFEKIQQLRQDLDELCKTLGTHQVERIQDRTSKTRLTILFYGLLADSQKIADRTLDILEIFRTLDMKRNKHYYKKDSSRM